LTENPYKSIRIDPDSGSTLRISGSACPSLYGPGHHTIELRIVDPGTGVSWLRGFELFVPDAMPLSTPRPSVVNWHGCGSDPQRFDSGQPTTTRLDLSGSRTYILNEDPEWFKTVRAPFRQPDEPHSLPIASACDLVEVGYRPPSPFLAERELSLRPDASAMMGFD
jgi:hypothetical protein